MIRNGAYILAALLVVSCGNDKNGAYRNPTSDNGGGGASHILDLAKADAPPLGPPTLPPPRPNEPGSGGTGGAPTGGAGGALTGGAGGALSSDTGGSAVGGSPNTPGFADADGDGCVGYSDYGIVMYNYGFKTTEGADPRADFAGDDHFIDFADYLLVIQQWGTGCHDGQDVLPDYSVGCTSPGSGVGGAAPGTLRADVDGDGCYSLRDQQIMGDNYLQSTEHGADPRADLDGDCWVGNEEDASLMEEFRKNGPHCAELPPRE